MSASPLPTGDAEWRDASGELKRKTVSAYNTLVDSRMVRKTYWLLERGDFDLDFDMDFDLDFDRDFDLDAPPFFFGEALRERERVRERDLLLLRLLERERLLLAEPERLRLKISRLSYTVTLGYPAPTVLLAANLKE